MNNTADLKLTQLGSYLLIKIHKKAFMLIDPLMLAIFFQLLDLCEFFTSLFLKDFQ